MKRFATLSAFSFGMACAVASAEAQTVLDTSFTLEPFVTGIGTTVTGMEWAPDGSQRLFVLRKNGQVRIVEDGALLAEPFATMAPIVTTSECGLIGMAFDPDFSNNGFVYFFVTVSSTEQQIIRYTAVGNTGTERTVIVSGLPTRGANHDGGALAFGPDGMLYWAVGDLGNGTGVDADLSLLAAKVGRAHPDGSVVNDNPFFDGDGPNNDYIWARGFRNPFTMVFQPTTEELWVNVVGTGWEQIFRVSAGDHAGYNDYEANQPEGYLAPVVAYRTRGGTNNPFAAPIAAVTRLDGVASYATSADHRLRPGGLVTISGVTNASFNGTFRVDAVAGARSFSVAQPAADASSSAGSAVGQDVGGCVTGGIFWDSSGVPEPYRGNFFFGDYISGQLTRVSLGSENQVQQVTAFGTTFGRLIDSAIGPDGTLYVVNAGGSVSRLSHNATEQGLVVSRLHLRTQEGASPAFHVRLALEPSQERVVEVARLNGDTDVSVSEGMQLRFTPADWSVPQTVRLLAAEDPDSEDDLARFRVASLGLDPVDVVTRVTDNDKTSLEVSHAQLTLDEGTSATIFVALSEAPLAPLTVNVERSAGSTDAVITQGQTLAFGVDDWWAGQAVVIEALEDDDTEDDSATLTLASDAAPTRLVEVSIRDNDDRAPVITSTPPTTAVLGAPYTYFVMADGLPPPMFSLDQAPAGMSVDPASGEVVWTPESIGTFNVVLRAENGVAPDALQAFAIETLEDQAPTCQLTAPQPGAVLSGSMQEFFGDVVDDVAASRAEFSIDGVVAYTDDNEAGHYHYGGTHNLFDTRPFEDGSHTLSMVGYDTSGQTCSAEVQVTIDNASGGSTGNEGSGGAAGASATEQSATSSGGAPDSIDGLAGAAGEASGPQARSRFVTGSGGCSCHIDTAPAPGSLFFAAGLIVALVRRRREPSPTRERRAPHISRAAPDARSAPARC